MERSGCFLLEWLLLVILNDSFGRSFIRFHDFFDPGCDFRFVLPEFFATSWNIDIFENGMNRSINLEYQNILRIQRIGFIRSWWFPPPKNGRIRTRRTWFCVAPCLSSRRARSQTGPGSPGARWCWSMWIIVERSIPRVKHSWSIAGWWFGCHQFYFRRNIGFLIIPIDSNIFYRGVHTTNQIGIALFFGDLLSFGGWHWWKANAIPATNHHHSMSGTNHPQMAGLWHWVEHMSVRW